MFWVRRIARHLIAIAAVMLAGTLLAATLVRFAPGLGTEQQLLDSRLNEESLRAIRDAHADERDLFRYYGKYVTGLLRGDLGASRSLGRPVAELLAERIPVTLRSVTSGLVIGWSLGLALAFLAVSSRLQVIDLCCTLLSGATLCLPVAVLALLIFLLRGPVPLAIGLTVFPKVFRYTRNILVHSYGSEHLLTARAKGLTPIRVFFWHVLPIAAPQILALAGVSVSMALGAAVPIEAICSSPGIGQLAWMAALSRDVAVLLTLTAIVTVATLLANSAADLANLALADERR